MGGATWLHTVAAQKKSDKAENHVDFYGYMFYGSWILF